MSRNDRHLALFLSGLAGGGAQRRMVTLANAFAERGHRVDLVPVRSRGDFAGDVGRKVKLEGLDPWWLGGRMRRASQGPAVLGSVPALASWLRRHRPDVLLSSSNPANVAALLARRLAGTDTPVVISVNVQASQAASHRHPLLAFLMRRLYPDADGLIAISEGVAEDLAAFAAIAPERIATVHNPVDFERIALRAQEPLEDEWLAEGAPPLVLGVGKLKPQKDFATLLRAFAKLHERRAARLVILGEGGERVKLAGLAGELGIADDVRMPGFENNPAAWMARASVLALSSAWEGFSNVLVEALACGCPVVSTNCPSGPAEILEHGALGPLVPVGDAEALALALERVLDAPPDPAVLRARAASFSVDRAAECYLEVLEQARLAPERRAISGTRTARA